jgi:hypothetical protein
MNKIKSELTSFYTGKSALLVGNGINLLRRNLSWDALLSTIAQNMNVAVSINRNKSYPLVFEEILFRSDGNLNDNLRRLKEDIYNVFSNYNPTDFHEILMRLKVDDFLTTNYDYSLEQVFEDEFNISSGFTNEYKYSLFRYNNILGKKIWHIHGELNNGVQGVFRYPQESIMIGYEHYGDYHRRIHEFIKPPGGILNGLTQDKDSWVKRFFTHNIHIVGFGLDFSEAHLWWLLNYRARIKKEFGSIPNKIYYHYASFNSANETYLAKFQILEALDVESVPTQVNTFGEDKYIEYWDNLLNNTLPEYID